MNKDRNEKLTTGVNALFGKLEEEPTTDAIDTVKDEELKKALRQRQLDGRGRPKGGRPKDSRTEGYSTVCVKANTEKWEKLKYISLQETLQIKETLELAIDMLIEKYESENGKIELKAKKVFNK